MEALKKKCRVKPSIYNLTDQLELAIEQNDIENFQEALEEICSVAETVERRTQLLGPAMLTAIRANSPPAMNAATVVSTILSRDININQVVLYSNTLLILAAEKGNETVVKLLLEAGCEVNRTDTETRTALHWASMNGHEEVVRLLLAYHCAVDQRDSMYRFTPLMLAARGGHTNIVSLLLETGRINVDNMDKYGETPLFDAVRNNQIACARLLLEAGSDSHHLDDNNASIMHTAIAYKRTELIKILLEANIDIHSKGHYRHMSMTGALSQSAKDPLECAITEQQWQYAKLLVAAGAPVHDKHGLMFFARGSKTIGSLSFPQVPDWLLDAPSEPYSLRQACRVAIRRRIGGVKAAEKILALDIPGELKRYLLLTEELANWNVTQEMDS